MGRFVPLRFNLKAVSLKILKLYIPYSRKFSNQKFSYKCLKINFGGFTFEVSIFWNIVTTIANHDVAASA